MLIQISIKNYKSIKEEVVFSLIPSNYHKELEDTNLIHPPDRDYSILKSAVIYGANASGKSILLKAMDFIRTFIVKSSKDSQANESIKTDPFRLSIETEHEPSSFELIFLHKNTQYRYGFEANSSKISTEWLYAKKKREVEIFFREGQKFYLNESRLKIGKTLTDKNMIRDNALFLSVSAQFNEKISNDILDWVYNFNVLSGIEDFRYNDVTIEMSKKSPEFKQRVLDFIKYADLGIEDFSFEDFSPSSLPDSLPDSIKEALLNNEAKMPPRILTYHKKFDKNKIPISKEIFLMGKDESSGTQKYFAFAGPILDTLEHGGVFVIDELDARLHSVLVLNIVKLFHSPKINKKNAQLIFATHDTNLLSSNLFRRDQIWFIEKDRYGESSMYSLADFKITSEDKSKKVRFDENFEKNYFLGKYGAIPYIGNPSSLISKKVGSKK